MTVYRGLEQQVFIFYWKTREIFTVNETFLLVTARDFESRYPWQKHVCALRRFLIVVWCDTEIILKVFKTMFCIFVCSVLTMATTKFFLCFIKQAFWLFHLFECLAILFQILPSENYCSILWALGGSVYQIVIVLVLSQHYFFISLWL